jgi:hyperosmotically inducible periplasmic protein
MQRNRMHPVPKLALIALPIALALSAPLVIAHGTIDDQARADASMSGQPVADSWITTKVKADLLVTEETKGLDINVSTQNGVVTLAGRLDSQAQVEKAAAVVRAIKGVKSVDTTTLTVKP